MPYDLPSAVRSKTVHDIALKVFVAAMGHQLSSRDAEAAAATAYEAAKLSLKNERRKAADSRDALLTPTSRSILATMESAEIAGRG